MKAGDLISFERVFTVDDVEQFTKLSRDEGLHHVAPDEEGRLVVQGLLTTTLPTKIGGDANVLARTMNVEFLRPVYTGDLITCQVKIEKYQPIENERISIEATFVCKNQDEKDVLLGSFTGIIL